MASAAARTMFEKIWARHVVSEGPGGHVLLYVGRHLLHEGSTAAFARLAAAGRRVRRAGLPVAAAGPLPPAAPGAFGALAFGIGSTEVERGLATQTLWQQKPRVMRITVEGRLGPGVTAKDLILAIIARIGAAGGVGHAIEYAGSTIRALSMDERMTVCNMSIEAGGGTGKGAPRENTFPLLRHERPPRGPARRGAGGPGAPRAGARLGRARLGPRQARGRGRGARPRLRPGRLRVARGGLLDVRRHERRDGARGRARGLHLQPQLRGPPGQGRAHPCRVARDGGGGRRHGPLRRRPGPGGRASGPSRRPPG